VMWGHSGWAAGFWKHPPLLPWVTRAWFTLLPLHPTSLALLTALNLTLCAWAVSRIAAMAAVRDDRRLGVFAVLLLASVPYANGMAVKLNHNTALISLWPLTTLAFLRALDRPTVLHGALFGLAAAAAVLTKYYSGLLLVACLVASIAVPARAIRFYRSPAPYLAVAVFALAMVPHALWLLDHRASTLAYAFAAGASGGAEMKRGPAMALSFALQTPLILAPLALAALLFRRADGGRAAGAPHRFEREILILAVLPYLLTIVMTAAFNLRGAIAWAMPVFLCLPALVGARLGTPSPAATGRAAMIAGAIVLCLALAGQVGLRMALARGADGIAEPRQAIAEAVTGMWRTATGRPLALVAGDQRLASAAVILSPDHPQAWPSFNPVHAPWVDPAAAARNGFIALCRAGDAACAATAETYAGGRAVRCTLKRRVTYLGTAGPWFEVLVLLVPPAGVTPALACPAE